MRLLGNLIWLIFGGIFWAIGLFFAGLIFCITIIGIPIGLQMFKLAGFVLLPFGKSVKEVNSNGAKALLNIIWIIFFGIWFMFGFAITGLLFCITIIGIPFGLQYFKIARFVLTPLGHDFE